MPWDCGLYAKDSSRKQSPTCESDFPGLTEKNPNPYDGEAFYNLGLALKFQGKNDEAYNSFYKSCWNAAWQDAGYYSLAQISVSRGNWEEALGEIEKILITQLAQPARSPSESNDPSAILNVRRKLLPG